jgi:hypothetical protein
LFTDETPELKHDVDVRNETAVPVYIEHIQQSCGCAGSTRLAKRGLAPGEVTTLHFAIDLRNRIGPQRFVCRLIEKGGSSWSYELETTLYRRAQFSEVGAIHFGMLDPGQKAEKLTEFFLHARNEADFPDQVNFHTKSDRIRLETKPPRTIREANGIYKRGYDLVVNLLAPELPGFATADIVAELRSVSGKQVRATSLSWNVRSFYAIEPAQIFFGRINQRESSPITKVLTIRRLDSHLLAIKGIRVKNSALKAMAEPSAAVEERRLKITLDPKQLHETLWEEIHIETNVPAPPVLRVPVAALVE